jgi:type III secretory pathway component EscV
MKKNLFIVELVKSPPFLIFIILALLITIGVIMANRKEKVTQMKEDVLYIAPKPK